MDKTMFNEIIKRFLGLTKAELIIVEKILKITHEFDALELSDTLGFDVSTIQRCVKKLSELDLISKRQINLSKGGCLFKYKIKSREIIAEKIITMIEKQAEKELKTIREWGKQK